MEELDTRLVLTFSEDNVPVIAEVIPEEYDFEDTDVWINNTFKLGEHPLSSWFKQHLNVDPYTASPDLPNVWIYKGKSYRREKNVVLSEIMNTYLDNASASYLADVPLEYEEKFPQDII
tara:strand:+ start:708 stop:1064 length:357 start_codon:yes stop_codon:yes gene_type:complete